MDEYQLEIAALRRTLAKLRADKAEASLIEEYEAELRILVELYRAATETFAAGEREPRLRQALHELSFGDWTLPNVYTFVYEAATSTETDGRDLANVVAHTNYADTLLLEVNSDV